MTEFLENADCFVLASQAEGLPNAVIEAMFYELPIVTTNVGGNVDLVEDGKSGFLVPPNNKHIFAEKIIKLFSDP